MQEFIVSVRPELSHTGSSRALSGTIDESAYEFAGLELVTPGGIAYDLVLSNTGEAATLTGTVSAHVETQCARCLEPVVLDVAGQATGYYLFDAQARPEGMEVDEYGHVGADGTVDLADAVQAALAYATPFVILCREDCRGLCPKCGANLNEDPDHAHEAEIDPANPFAVLKDLKLGEQE